MLIIGAKGFAKEVLEVLFQNNIQNIFFFDDVNPELTGNLYGKFPMNLPLELVIPY